MTKVSIETLKEMANAYWSRKQGLPAKFWTQYAKAGLYDWAWQAQQSFGIGDYIPSKEALLEQHNPTPAGFVLAPSPTPPTAPIKPEGPISVRMRRRGQEAVAAVVARNNQSQAIAYSPHDFVQFALPHKKLDSSVYERVNGRFRVILTSRDGFAVPFGQDRLFPLWLATAFHAAGQPADNTIRFRSATDILSAFRQRNDGGATTALRERIERWLNTQVDIKTTMSDSIHQVTYSLIEECHLWFARKGVNSQLTLWQNVIKLHSRFADDLRRKTIPVDFETVVALRDTPGALDLYIWQAHRSWELMQTGATRPTAVKIEQLLQQLGTQSPPRKAKQLLQRWQRIVKEVWGDCPNYVDGGKDLFMLYPGRSVFERSTAKLPGVLPEPPVPLRALQSATDADALVLRVMPEKR
jgi:hypothetical protein